MSNHVYLGIQQTADADCYPFTVGQLRHYLSLRHRNGLDRAVRKVGKRLYLRQDLFEQWIESQNNEGGCA